MTEDNSYFGNIRTVGATIDQGIAKLQEKWQMPHLFFCKSKEEDQAAAKKLVEIIKNELNILKQEIEENKTAISTIREDHTQFLLETGEAIRDLKEQVNDMKILFTENGYEEDINTASDVSSLNNQLELLSVNSSIPDSSSESNAYSNSLINNTLSTDSFNQASPSINNISFNSVHKRSLLNERPKEPIYSPYFHRMVKKK